MCHEYELTLGVTVFVADERSELRDVVVYGTPERSMVVFRVEKMTPDDKTEKTKDRTTKDKNDER